MLGRARAAVERLRQQLPVLLRLLAPELLHRLQLVPRRLAPLRMQLQTELGLLALDLETGDLDIGLG